MKVSCVSLIRIADRVLAINCSKGRGYILPGGKHEPGETFKQTAARELFEETGLTATKQSLVFHCPNTEGRYVMTFATAVKNFHFATSRTEEVVLASWDELCDSHYGGYYNLLREVMDKDRRLDYRAIPVELYDLYRN